MAAASQAARAAPPPGHRRGVGRAPPRPDPPGGHAAAPSRPEPRPPPGPVQPLLRSSSKRVARSLPLRLGLVGALLALPACSPPTSGTNAPPRVTATSTPPTTIAPTATGVYDHTGPADLSPAVAGVPTRVYVPNTESDTVRSEEHTSELQSLAYLVCRLLLDKKKEHA